MKKREKQNVKKIRQYTKKYGKIKVTISALFLVLAVLSISIIGTMKVDATINDNEINIVLKERSVHDLSKGSQPVGSIIGCIYAWDVVLGSEDIKVYTDEELNNNILSLANIRLFQQSCSDPYNQLGDIATDLKPIKPSVKVVEDSIKRIQEESKEIKKDDIYKDVLIKLNASGSYNGYVNIHLYIKYEEPKEPKEPKPPFIPDNKPDMGSISSGDRENPNQEVKITREDHNYDDHDHDDYVGKPRHTDEEKGPLAGSLISKAESLNINENKNVKTQNKTISASTDVTSPGFSGSTGGKESSGKVDFLGVTTVGMSVLALICFTASIVSDVNVLRWFNKNKPR